MSILDANVRNNNQESEEILGKLLVLEKIINTNETKIQNNTLDNLGRAIKPPGATK